MRIHLVFQFLILSLLFIPAYQKPSQRQGRKVYGFKLALQWPNSYCNGDWHCKLPIPQQFKIHGFWPMDVNGHVMTNEDQSGEDYLKEEDVAHIKTELDEMWPDLRVGSSNFNFWAEEWRKHGRDIGFNPRSYFELAIQCKRNLDAKLDGDLVDYLSGKDLGPNESAAHARHHFPIKIRKRTNFDVEIKCNTNTADGKSQLLEIYICFTETGDFYDCNSYYEGRKKHYFVRDCEETIIFPIEKERPHDEL